MVFVSKLHACNRPFPSSSQPPFQSEAKCEVLCYENQFSFILKLELIIITKNFALRLALKGILRGIRKWPPA